MWFSKKFQSTELTLSYVCKVQKTIRGNKSGALLITDLSKDFGSIDHKLLFTKLYCLGVSPGAKNIISSYLKNWTQLIKINDYFSDRSIIEYGLPQGSVLTPLLFNNNIIDLFYECEESDIANFAGDTTPYYCSTNIPTVISEL